MKLMQASSAIFSEYTKVRVQMIEIPLSDPHPEDLHDCEPASQSTDIAVVSNPSNITEVNNNSGKATARILELLMSMKESMEVIYLKYTSIYAKLHMLRDISFILFANKYFKIIYYAIPYILRIFYIV